MSVRGTPRAPLIDASGWAVIAIIAMTGSVGLLIRGRADEWLVGGGWMSFAWAFGIAFLCMILAQAALRVIVHLLIHRAEDPASAAVLSGAPTQYEVWDVAGQLFILAGADGVARKRLPRGAARVCLVQAATLEVARKTAAEQLGTDRPTPFRAAAGKPTMPGEL